MSPRSEPATTVPDEVWQDPAFQQRPSWTQHCMKRTGCLAPDGHDGPHSISAWQYERNTP